MGHRRAAAPRSRRGVRILALPVRLMAGIVDAGLEDYIRQLDASLAEGRDDAAPPQDAGAEHGADPRGDGAARGRAGRPPSSIGWSPAVAEAADFDASRLGVRARR